MAVSWTAEQQKVIDTRGRNLLVSAAAGSGKTAVLVERILTMVMDPAHLVDIDRLLVVTFTNAAAAEMKNRIAEALEKRLLAEPDNAHLRRQMVLVNHAKITTIHSFCTYLIRNYFSRITLDPDFRIAEEGELKLLKEDVLEALRNDAYEAQSAEFQYFVDSYAQGKADGGLSDYILNLYEFAMSYPFPEEQLEAWRADYAAGAASKWQQELVGDVRRKAGELMEQCDYGLAVCRGEEGPYIYEEMLKDDRLLLERLTAAQDYEGIYRLLAGHSFLPLSRKRPKDIDPDRKAAVKALRDQVKGHIQDLQKAYGTLPPEMLAEEDASSRVAVEVLISLTLAFKKRYDQVKRDKNILDFGDLEHFALEILLDEDDGAHVPSDVARELGEYFEEILIDEYQDSNLLQETLLTTVSGLRDGRHNMFRVGDVKQSIYRFRLARPELFMEKYHTYAVDEAQAAESRCQRIDLHRNFRSRPEVIDSVNDVFRVIMGEALGGIDYDEDASLYLGRSVEAAPGFETELCLIDEQAAGDELSGRELEARATAQKIKELTQPGSGFSYKDVAILLRSYTGWAEVFAEALSAEGIPAFVQSKTGYFNTTEVATVLDFLRVIDNPRQDIPLAAVLKSPIGGLTTTELAQMVAAYRNAPPDAPESEPVGADKAAEAEPGAAKAANKGSRALSEAELYEAFLWNEAQGAEPLRGKLVKFGQFLRQMRQMAQVKGTYDLLSLLLAESGYELFAAAMPGGEARSANLAMLKQKAIDYEATSYHSLFDFVRYIEKMQKFEMDFGEASITGENENAVRIYSIHKSKGLEFPICFVCGTHKKFNQSDTRKRILLHADLGVATDVVDPIARTRRSSLRKKVLANRVKADNLGEELRVLYVALTRAREKLILTASVSDVAKTLEAYGELQHMPGERVPYTYLLKASSYLDWLLMVRHRRPGAFAVNEWQLADVVEREVERQAFAGAKRAELDGAAEWPTDEAAQKVLDEQLAFQYPYEKAVRMHRKVSVSDLKKAAMEEQDGFELFPQSAEQVGQEFGEPAKEAAFESTPESGAALGGLVGSARGTAYHRFLECVQYGGADIAYVRAEKARLLAAGKMRQEELDCIRDEDVAKFLQSPIGQRMARAEARGQLKRERQFVMGVSSTEAGLDLGTEETLLIQGIMDACFLEADAWVLVDYKTDRVPYQGGEEILRERYRVQLDYYRRALEQMTGLPVRECWIYAFALHRGFSV